MWQCLQVRASSFTSSLQYGHVSPIYCTHNEFSLRLLLTFHLCFIDAVGGA